MNEVWKDRFANAIGFVIASTFFILVGLVLGSPFVLYSLHKNRVKDSPQSIPEGLYEFHCVTKYGSMSCRPMHESLEDLRGRIKFEGEE